VPNRLPRDSVTLDHVVFESDRIQPSRDFVALVLRSLKAGVAGPPLQQVGLGLGWKGSSFQLLAPGIDQPHTGLLPELGAEVEPVGLSRVRVRRGGQRELRQRATPLLVSKPGRLQPDGLVEAADKTVREGNRKERRTLMRNQPPAIDDEFVSLRFSTENWMVVQNEASLAFSCEPLEEERSGQPADSATNHHTVVCLASVDYISGQEVEHSVANLVSGGDDVPGVPVRGAVVSHATKAGPVLVA